MKGFVAVDSRNSVTHRSVPIGALKAYDAHARQHNRHQRRKIRRLVEQIGTQPVPIMVTPDLVIVDGHAIWETMREIGAAQVLVAILQNQTPAGIKALRLAINRIPEDTRWDKSRLRQEIGELISLSYDLESTAFDVAELDSLMQLDLPKANVIEDEGAIPPFSENSVARTGDIFQLGPHRIGCGSAHDYFFVERVRESRPADLCIIDPPYNVPIDGHVSGKGRHRHREFMQGVGELSSQEFFSFLKASLEVLRTSCSPRALIYAFIDFRHVLEMTAAGRALNLPLLNICIWVKPNGGMGALYRSRHEFVCVFKAGGESHTNNVELGRFGRNRTNVWQYPGMSSFGSERDELLAAHPTVKPVVMIADAIRDVTKRGDAVLDTFIGSGSTVIAAEETGRTCFGVELDPHYVDVAVRRWQNATGRDAVQAETGARFDDLAAARELQTRRLAYGA
jgi:DNA modification methylase